MSLTEVLVLLVLIVGLENLSKINAEERGFRQIVRESREKRRRQEAQISAGDWSDFERELREAGLSSREIELHKQTYAESLRERKKEKRARTVFAFIVAACVVGVVIFKSLP